MTNAFANAPLEAEHSALGARLGSLSGLSLPRHYGDPAAEYDAARTGAVVIDRADRRVYRLHGRDPVKMIQGLVTNDIAGAPDGQGIYGTYLTPKGKMVAESRLWRRGGEVWGDVDAAAADALAAHIKKFVPPLFARFQYVDYGVIGVYGPSCDDIARDVFGAQLPSDAEDAFVELDAGVLGNVGDGVVGGGSLMRTAYAGVPGLDAVLPASSLADSWRASIDAGARPAGHSTLDVLRIEAGRPRWGAELTDATIPLEAGLRERAISETKGCYTGQEVIIRILHRGHVNWTLRGFLFGDAPAPAPGAELTRAGEAKALARITSACASPQFGETIGLGYARREVEVGTALVLGGAEVRVVGLPFRSE